MADEELGQVDDVSQADDADETAEVTDGDEQETGDGGEVDADAGDEAEDVDGEQTGDGADEETKEASVKPEVDEDAIFQAGFRKRFNLDYETFNQNLAAEQQFSEQAPTKEEASEPEPAAEELDPDEPVTRGQVQKLLDEQKKAIQQEVQAEQRQTFAQRDEKLFWDKATQFVTKKLAATKDVFSGTEQAEMAMNEVAKRVNEEYTKTRTRPTPQQLEVHVVQVSKLFGLIRDQATQATVKKAVTRARQKGEAPGSGAKKGATGKKFDLRNEKDLLASIAEAKQR